MSLRPRSRLQAETPYPLDLDPTSPVPWEPTTDGRVVENARTAELRYPVPFPTRLPTGHTGYMPWRPGARDPSTPEGFHATPIAPGRMSVPECDRPHPSDWPAVGCPCCGGRLARPETVLERIGSARLGSLRLPIYRSHRTTWTDRRTHCLVCNGRDPESEHDLNRQRRQAERDRSEREVAATVRFADRGHVATLESDRGDRTLTEIERRRIWLGYRGSIHASPDEVDRALMPTERALAGRAWLRSIGQEPDWSVILDRTGRAVGQYVYDHESEQWIAKLPEAS